MKTMGEPSQELYARLNVFMYHKISTMLLIMNKCYLQVSPDNDIYTRTLIHTIKI